jgi:two-component system sensor histidine kinase KdpD
MNREPQKDGIRLMAFFISKPYSWVTLVIALLTAMLYPFASPSVNVNIALIYLLPVLVSAVYGGIGPSLYAAALGVLAFDFFYVPPFLSFTVADLNYLVSFVVFLAVASLTASLASRLKQQLRLSKMREAHTAALYELSREMSEITDLQPLLSNVTRQVASTMRKQAVVYIPNSSGELELIDRSLSSDWGDRESERVIAKWVYENGELAGRGSHTLRETPGLFLPLRTPERIHGVLAVDLESSDAELSQDSRQLLKALCGLAASAIARLKLSEEAKLAHLTAESERLRTALLDSVSHELRTPLAAIIGSATALIEGERLLTPQDKAKLLIEIRDGALRMNRLVTNLLGMVQLESGMLRLRQNWCDVEEIIGVVLSHVKDYKQHRRIRVKLPDQVLLLQGDEVLLEQMLVNVVSNAIKYSPDYSEIVIEARIAEGNFMVITVADSGIGLSPKDRERIFDKFYRADSARHVPGTGLGLAICKGIANLHGGTITAELNGDQGTVIVITLPVGE